MKRIFWFVCGLLIAAALNAPFVYAADPLPSIGSNGVITYSTENNARQWMELNKTSTLTGGNIEYNTTPKTFTLGTANGARVPVTIDAVATRVLTPANLAKAGLALLKKNPVLITGVAADIMSQLDLHYDTGQASFVQGIYHAPVAATLGIVTVNPSGVYYYQHSNCWTSGVRSYNTPTEAQADLVSSCKAYNPSFYQSCTTAGGVQGASSGTYQVELANRNCAGASSWLLGSRMAGCISPAYSSNGTCVKQAYTCPSGYTLSGQSCNWSGTQGTLKTEAQAQDLVEPLIADPQKDPFYQGLDDTEPVNVGNDIPLNPSLQQTPNSPTTVTPPVNGQQTITSPKRVTDQGDGTRKEEQTVINTTTTGDTITYNITNVSNIINNTTGATVSTETSTTTGSPPTPDTSGTFNDTPMPSVDPLIEMPAVPDFYTQKYPNGMSGEWQTFKTTIDQSSLVTTLHAMAPNWSGGECPSWTFNMNTGMVNLGVHDLAPPCWIFPILKIILMVTALFVARGLIFGG